MSGAGHFLQPGVKTNNWCEARNWTKSTLEYEAGVIMHTEGYFAILGSRKESSLIEFYSFITFSKTHLNVLLIEFHDLVKMFVD